MSAAPVSPGRAAVDAAAAVNAENGHENLGAVTETWGFLPTSDPLDRLPPSYRCWDEAAAALPDLYHSLRLRRELDALPRLSGQVAYLPDAGLQRAATVLGILVHAYHRVQPLRPVTAAPEALRVPWTEVCARLGRPSPALTYSDLIVTNWRRTTPAAPLTVEHLRLLVPTVDNDEERRFYLTQVEMLAHAAPLVGVALRAQAAVARDDPDALAGELRAAGDCLDVVATVGLPLIDPNPRSSSHVDPVVWAKTVAPLAVPVEAGGPGPSGTSSPLFHLMDVLLGRTRHGSLLGKEARQLRAGYPAHWKAFLTAVGEPSIPAYVLARGDREAAAALCELLDRYAGSSGLLGRHQLKIYGYIELAFKLGRNITIGGFTGLFRDRTWDEVDKQVAASRAERTIPGLALHHRLTVRQVNVTPPDGPGTVRQVVLDLSGSGVRYFPGDRVHVRAENDDRQVIRTLGVMRASPDQRVPLTPSWAACLGTALPEARLEDVLRLAQLRPVDRQVAVALLALTGDGALRDVVRSRTEHGWEVWDLLELIATRGFDPSRLWRAQLGEPESLCRLLVPAAPRTYSAASSLSASPGELHLTVGRVEYETGRLGSPDGHLRQGTASFFLTRPPTALTQGTDRVTVSVERPPRFRLPPKARTPLLLFAGGTGLSPFRGFLQERALQPDAGPVWLFVSARRAQEICYREELTGLAASSWLQVRVAVSRDSEVDALRGLPTRRGRVADLLGDGADGRALWQLIQGEARPDEAARVYVCGNAGYAASVAEALSGLVRRYSDQPARPDPGREHLRRMLAQGRYVEELYTTHSDPAHPPQRLLDVSELVLHNGGPGRTWTAIGDQVYDISDFLHEHPGGASLLRGYAGMDATHAFEQVGHHDRPDVAAHLPRYELGALRPLALGREWGVALTPSGLQTQDLAGAHTAWVQVLYLAVEMQNALANDMSARDRPTTRGRETLADAYSLQLAVETQVTSLDVV